MIDSLYVVSAEELFGTANRLVVESGVSVEGGLASLTSAYQAAVALVAMAYLISVVRFSDVLFYIISSMISGRKYGNNDNFNLSVASNIERLMLGIGIILIALTAMRFSIVTEGEQLFQPLGLTPWPLFFVVAGGVGALMLVEIACFYFMRAFARDGALWRELMHTKLLYFSSVITIITPFLLVSLLTQGMSAVVAGGAALVLCAISLLIFLKETFSLFISHRFSLFHWILYLCTLEIFPLSLLLAPILRKGL